MQHLSTTAKPWPLYPAHDVMLSLIIFKMAAQKTVFIYLNYSFAFNTRYEHFYNLKLLYSGYLSKIFLYKRYLFFVTNVL